VNRACAVYRWFAPGGRLLYVGRSADPDQRWISLRSSERWTHLACRRSLEWYESVAEAKAAARDAIKTAGPVFNVQCRRDIRTRRPGETHKTTLVMTDGFVLRIWYARGQWLLGDEQIAQWRRSMIDLARALDRAAIAHGE
jgi:hypothetical protein